MDPEVFVIDVLAPIAASTRVSCYVLLWLIFVAWGSYDAVRRRWIAAVMHFLLGFYMFLSAYYILFGGDARIPVFVTTPTVVGMVAAGAAYLVQIIRATRIGDRDA